MPEVAFTDEQVRALADEVLARPPYAVFRERQGWLGDVVDRVEAALRRLSDAIPDWVVDLWEAARNSVVETVGGLFGDGGLATLIRFALAIAVLAAFTTIVIAVLRELRDQHSGSSGGPGARTGEPKQSLLAEAEHLAGLGRFLEAAHAVQLAALEVLLRREWVVLERSDPNRTLRRRLREAALPDPERGEFLSLLDRLEGRWFRDRVEDRDLYAAWCGLHGRLVRLPVSR